MNCGIIAERHSARHRQSGEGSGSACWAAFVPAPWNQLWYRECHEQTLGGRAGWGAGPSGLEGEGGGLHCAEGGGHQNDHVTAYKEHVHVALVCLRRGGAGWMRGCGVVDGVVMQPLL